MHVVPKKHFFENIYNFWSGGTNNRSCTNYNTKQTKHCKHKYTSTYSRSDSSLFLGTPMKESYSRSDSSLFLGTPMKESTFSMTTVASSLRLFIVWWNTSSVFLSFYYKHADDFCQIELIWTLSSGKVHLLNAKKSDLQEVVFSSARFKIWMRYRCHSI